MDEYLVEPDWLEKHLGDTNVVVIDCSWYIPEAGKSGYEEFLQSHIPGARFFDLDAASDSDSPYVNMLPGADEFARTVSELGIDNSTMVVVYDSSYVSARVWWMFRLYGHEKVRILNGGWKRWIDEGRPVENGKPGTVESTRFKAVEPAGGVVGWKEVANAINSGNALVVDARTRERFTGELPSGYPGVAGGHMPGAINIPWSNMLPQSGDFTFVDRQKAESIFRDAGVDLKKKVISTCGSGVTAAVLAFQMARIGKSDWVVYDGSWHEWGQRDDLPKESE